MTSTTEQQELTETDVSTDTLSSVGIMYKLILWNDDFNTFEHVIACLVKFMKKTYEEATEIAFTVHNEGKCILLEAAKYELVELYHILVLKGLTVSIE